jgi:hypothetical protein
MRINYYDGTLKVYFDGTEPTFKSWLLNFMTWKAPYKNMTKLWFVHAGFLSRWKQLQDQFKALITDKTHTVELIGLSQGGTTAILAHEFVWYNYPHLRPGLKTIVYGSPRCIGLWGFWRIKDRFATLCRIEHWGDFVCNVPPALFGFIHVGTRIRIGKFTFDIRKSHGSYNI